MAYLGSNAPPLGASDCELLRAELLAQPANTISSLAFVVVGVAIAALALRGRGWRTRSLVFAGCLVATGLGSVAYHGPQPPGAELMHDLSEVRVFGVFLELEDGSEGFVDAAAMSEPWLDIPEQQAWPRVGDIVTGRVVGVRDTQTRLSIRPSDLRALSEGE